MDLVLSLKVFRSVRQRLVVGQGGEEIAGTGQAATTAKARSSV